MSGPRRIALFGGTFDPIHLGHLAIMQSAKEALSLDEVRVLPCHTSPHKERVRSAPADDRLTMVRLATRGLPWVVVDDYDLSRPQPAYSFQTAEEMASRYPTSRLFWIMGADQWRALPRWKEPDRLARIVDFIVFARDGEPESQHGWRMHFIRGTHPASATAVRQALAEGAADHDWLPPGVAAYIRDRGLYRDSLP